MPTESHGFSVALGYKRLLLEKLVLSLGSLSLIFKAIGLTGWFHYGINNALEFPQDEFIGLYPLGVLADVTLGLTHSE